MLVVSWPRSAEMALQTFNGRAIYNQPVWQPSNPPPPPPPPPPRPPSAVHAGDKDLCFWLDVFFLHSLGSLTFIYMLVFLSLKLFALLCSLTCCPSFAPATQPAYQHLPLSGHSHTHLLLQAAHKIVKLTPFPEVNVNTDSVLC